MTIKATSALSILAIWIASIAAVAAESEGDGASWMCIFAFLTAGAVANSGGNMARGGSAILWWAIAGALVVIGGDGWAWLCIPAFLLSAVSVGFDDFHLPRGLEW